MKTIQDLATDCVNEAVSQGALERDESGAFLGPASPMDGDFDYLAENMPADYEGRQDEARAVFAMAYEEGVAAARSQHEAVA